MEENKKKKAGDNSFKAERAAWRAEDFATVDLDNDGLITLKELGNLHILT